MLRNIWGQSWYIAKPGLMCCATFQAWPDFIIKVIIIVIKLIIIVIKLVIMVLRWTLGSQRWWRTWQSGRGRGRGRAESRKPGHTHCYDHDGGGDGGGSISRQKFMEMGGTPPPYLTNKCFDFGFEPPLQVDFTPLQLEGREVNWKWGPEGL